MNYNRQAFERGLEIIKKVPRVSLGIWPTPLQPMERLGVKAGIPLFMKRDDLNGLGPGGNKVRSLEYLLYEARQNGADTVLASGPAQSNLCTLAACAAAKLGMKAVLVHNAAAPSRFEGNALLNHLVGAESHYIGAGTTEFQRADRVAELEMGLRAEGREPYTVLLGASTGLGALGYVNVVAELVQQCLAAKIDLRHLFVPGGNGGVATGVVYGNWLLGSPFEVHVISVEDDYSGLRKAMERILDEIEPITGERPAAPAEDLCDLQAGYRGDGWSCNTPESAAMVEAFPKMEGVFIENVYNSKVVVAMLDYIQKGLVKENACYLHTGGFGSLFAQY